MNIPLEVTKNGLYCPQGDFYIDAWNPVEKCIITHAHGDHAREGHGQYIATEETKALLHYRLGQASKIQSSPYEKKMKMKDCWVSFHSAGHIFGSAQIRIETKKGVCVVSGDYKRAFDSTCQPFQVQECDIFVTESTFALPIYKWEPSREVIKNLYEWWQENKERGDCSIVYCYALGKAQRLLAELSSVCKEMVYVHGAIFSIAKIYEQHGALINNFRAIEDKKNYSQELILAPPTAKNSPWLRRFYPYKTAYASGWMQVRGAVRQKNVDKGFVLSDHADWDELLTTIEETKAKTVLTTHGNASTLARYLQENQKNAFPLTGLENLNEGEE